MRSSTLFAVTVLAAVLALSTAGNAFASTELAYDDGPPYGVGHAASQFVGGYLVVGFSLPPGWSNARLVEVRAYKVESPGTNVELHVWGADKTTELIAPVMWDIATIDSWNSISLNVVVSGDFYVALKFLYQAEPFIATGGTVHADRSFYLGGFVSGWQPVTEALAIRAYVDHIVSPAPVGGVVMPANTLAILMPWLAVIESVACISTVVVVAKKRKK